MTQPSFTECMNSIAAELASGNFKHENNPDFWYIIDHLDDKQTQKWLQRLIKTRYVTSSSDWFTLCGIADALNNFNPRKQSRHEVWSPTQKRFVGMAIARSWDYLSGDYSL